MKNKSYLALTSIFLLSTVPMAYGMEIEEIENNTPLKQKTEIISLTPKDDPQKLGLKMENKKFEEIIKFDNDIKKAIESYKEQGINILNSSEDKDIVVAIGNTGAGKSTLLNLLIENSLNVETSGYFLGNEKNINSFEIGHGLISETLMPKFIQKKNNIFLTFQDLMMRGHGTAFLNAIFIKDIITKAKTVVSVC
jgi:ABC-type sugar transport system ATPase subunit